MSFPLIAGALTKAFSAISSVAAPLQAGLAVATTATNYLSGAAQAEAMNESNAQATARANQYMIEDVDATTRMLQQENAAAVQKQNQNQIEANKAAATAQVAASSGGVTGTSVDALLADIWGQEASINDGINQNLEATQEQINRERRSIVRSTNEANASRPTAQKPSLFGAVLTAGTGVAGAYKEHWKINSKVG